MTTRKPLRTSVDPELYAAIERYARLTRTSVAESARYLLAFGVEALERYTRP